MGHGGHHGGGTHSGSHHSGGGYHGGGGHSSSYHSNHYSNHYSSHYYGSSSSSNGVAGLNSARKIMTFVYGGLTYLLLLVCVLGNEVPGMNFLNLTIYHAAAVFFIIGIFNYRRNSTARLIRNGKSVSVYAVVRKGKKSANVAGYETCWYGTADSSYYISFTDKYYGRVICDEVKSVISRGSKIIWMNQYFLMIIGIVTFIMTFICYELIIPIFEDMYMDDILFMFVDDFVFYLPSLLCLAVSVLCFVSGLIRDKLLYKCAVRVANVIQAAEQKRLTEAQISSQMQMKRYYLTCPNCGANYQQAYYNCMYCGSSLEVR